MRTVTDFVTILLFHLMDMNMSTLTPQGLNTLRQHLALFPDYITRAVMEHINDAISYEPVIGIMGKTGAGKSSLCNALFHQPLSPVSDTHSCTREARRFSLTLGERSMTLIDLPGVGESAACDNQYQALYQKLLPELDLILWVIKADDRACAPDEHFYHFLLRQGVLPSRIVFVLNQADKAEPSEEWDRHARVPSQAQHLTLAARMAVLSSCFMTPYPIHAVSARHGYNLSRLVETLVFALPPEASSGVFSQFREEHKNAEAEKQARRDFSDLLGELFDRIMDALPLPDPLRSLLQGTREGLVKIAGQLWHWFF